MARTDLPEPYAIRMARRSIRESLMSHGEEVIAFKMFHVYPDEGVQPRCPVCYNDVYAQAERADCTACFGTTFEGGIKEMSRMWALITTTDSTEQRKKRGQWQEKDRALQTEPFPNLYENDYILRVVRWSQDHRPLEFGGIYILGGVADETLRTGNQYAQTAEDRVGQRARATELSTDHVMYSVIGRVVRSDFSVPRLDGKQR